MYIFEYTKHKRVEISQALISGTFIQPHYPLALPPSNSYASLWVEGQMKEHVSVVTLIPKCINFSTPEYSRIIIIRSTGSQY